LKNRALGGENGPSEKSQSGGPDKIFSEISATTLQILLKDSDK
jgi:hypothetical protein